MSTMDRYEAIERIKTRFNKWALDDEDMKAIQTLIPELSESEDERIRKEIMDFIRWAIDRGSITKEQRERSDSWLAYFEKQKEQLKKGLGKYSEEKNIAYRLNWVMQDYYKAGKDDEERKHRFRCYKLFWDALEDENFFEPKKQNDGAEEYTDFTIYHPLKNGKGEYECIPYSFYGSLTSFSEDKDLIDFLRTCFYTKEECNEWIEKQKEQSFTHHQIDESLRDAVTHQMEDDGDVDDFVRKGIDDIAMKYAMLGARWQKEQKPVEWSAYDKATIEYAIEDIKGLRDEETDEEVIETYDRELNLLQCINDSVKLCNYTNSAEWSEEDLQHKSWILECLADGKRKMPEYAKDFHAAYNWLKSLRPQPHWKPSEEQTAALEYALGNGGKYNKEALKSLYNDLKKLM